MAGGAVSNVSIGVEENLVKQLQNEIVALRRANREQESEIDEAEREQSASAAEAARLAQENAQLLHDNEALRAELAQRPTTPPPRARVAAPSPAAAADPPAIPNAEDIERDVVEALREALGTGPDSTWEDAAGAARRRMVKTSSGIANAAVRTVKRAQATWLAEHTRLRDEAMETQRREATRTTELEEANATIRRLKQELAAAMRGLSDARSELERSEMQRGFEGAPPPPAPAPSAAQRERDSSAFAAFMESKRTQQQQTVLARSRTEGGGMNSLPPRSRGLDGGGALPPVPASSGGGGSGTSGGTRLPRLPPPPQGTSKSAMPPPVPPISDAGASTAAMRSMTDALEKKWKRHMDEQRSTKPSLSWLQARAANRPGGNPWGPA